MVQQLSPGVAITEVDSPVQSIEGVSTSNAGFAGWSPQGPAADTMPKLVTSFRQYSREFGGFTPNSQMANMLAGFFQNGGRSAYIQRISPADARLAEAKIVSQHTDEEVETGDGTTLIYSKTSLTSALAVNAGDSPIVPESFTLRWRSSHSGGASTGRPVFKSDGETILVTDGAATRFAGQVVGVGAVGSIDFTGTFAGPVADGDTLVLSDGTNQATFEFDVAADGVTAGNVAVDVSAAAADADVANAFVTALNGSTLGLYAAATGAVVAVYNTTQTGLSGNVVSWSATFANVAPTLTQPSGGLDVAGVDEALHAFVPNTLVLTVGGVTLTLSTKIDRWTYATAASYTAGTNYAVVDTRTGHFMFELAAAGSAVVVTAAFTAVEDRSATDNGSGVLVGDVTGASPANLLNYDTGAYNLTVAAGVAATGQIDCDSGAAAVTPLDDETFVLNDGINPEVTFFFDAGGATLVETATLRSVDISAAADEDDVKTAIIAAVNSAPPLLYITASDGGAGIVTLTHDFEGTVGNVSITETVTSANFAVTGMAGGLDEQVPHGPATATDGSPILAVYQIDAWDLDPVSEGAWGSDLRVAIVGNVDTYTALTGTYSLFDVTVQQANAVSGGFDILETYEALDFSDSAAEQYFAAVINDSSDYIRVTVPGADEAPLDLAGVARTRVLSAGDATAAGQTVVGTLGNAPVLARSVVITYTDSGDVARTILDDGNGNLTGDVDATGTNTLTYTSGAFDLKTLNPIKVGTFLTVSYRTRPTTTSVTDFGDAGGLSSDGAGAGAALPSVSGSVAWDGGYDGTFDSTNYGRTQFTSPVLEATQGGIFSFDRIEEILQLVVPDFPGDVTISRDLIDYADSRSLQSRGADRFVLLTVPQGLTAQEGVDWFRFELQRYSKYAAIYAPWVVVPDPIANNRPLTLPPMGHVAGVFARVDSTKNVAKAPAGTVDGQLKGISGLEAVFTEPQRDILYQNKINALISSRAHGLAVWGARTISNQSEWRYINVVRTFQFVEQSVWLNTQWIVFENNNAALRLRISGQLQSFLQRLYVNQYFRGNRPSEAFSITVDESNNPPESVDAGKVIIDIGLAVNKPAEFVNFRFSQKSTAIF